MGSKNKHAKPVGPATGSKAPLKHKEKRKNRKVKKGQQSAPISKHANAAEARSPRPPTAGGPSSPSKKGGSVLQKMREKLQGGHFRWINEQLYTTEGTHALSFMRKNPALFDQYHQGFREQTKGWPQRPVDAAIKWLAARPKEWKVADLGCGDAELASAVEQDVSSFDLLAKAPGVVACNIADLPLPPGSIDVAVFCLSLMGTDYGTFIEEAARVLRPSGWLWVAEVQSRFVDAQGKSVLNKFIAAVGELGLQLRRKDTSNSHFLVLEFQGSQGRGRGMRATEWPSLRACQYKKR